MWKLCYRFRVLDKDLGASHLVLVVIHVDRPEEVKDPLLLRTPPTWPCLSCQNGIPGYNKYTQQQQQPKVTLTVGLSCVLLSGKAQRDERILSRKHAGLNSPHQKLVEHSAVRKSSPSHSYVFPQSQVFNLMPGPTNRLNTTIHIEGWQGLRTCVNVCHSEDANLLSSQSFGLLVSLGLIQRI